MTRNPSENHELKLAEAFVQHTGSHIFLTGKAGTGKTTFLHKLKKNTEKRMIITAPTGVAAINAGGNRAESVCSDSARKKNGLLKALICW